MLKLGDKVTITAANREGQVRSIWHDIDGPSTKYLVRYYDSTDRVCDAWFNADELVAV